jgi:hypothetical protein
MKSLLVKLGVIFMVWKVFVSFILAILLLGCASNQPSAQPSYGESQTQYSCKNINLGMREDEILRVLGNPIDKRPVSSRDKIGSFDLRGVSEIWTYNRSGNFPLKIFFSNGRVINCQD